MASAVYFLFGLIILAYSCEAYKVLVVYMTPSRSHAILGEGVIRPLLAAGHEVTYITAYEYKNPPPNLRQIDVNSNKNIKPEMAMSLRVFIDKRDTVTNSIDESLLKIFMSRIATATLENENVQKLLSDSKKHFDVVIVEWMFTEILSGLAALYECPMIWISPVEVNWRTISLVDEAPNPAYTTSALSPNMAPFTLRQRMGELWSRIKAELFGFVYSDRMESNVYQNLIAPHILKRGREPPSYYDIRRNVSLVLGNSHVSMGEATSMPQNYKSIGGYHIEDNVKPLPEYLKKIMDGAKDGVIYFSMGSNLASKDWPEEVKLGLLKMFGSLKQTVLWKFEEDIHDKPKNVHILQWAPQLGILAHPNCVLFITHGGLLSTTETIHYGIPIIGLPIFGDQFINIKRAVKKGFALSVNLSPTTVDDLKAAIEEMLTNPKYRKTVKELSFIYHDRIAKPSAELVHWVQHVVRTRGAPHLRSPALHVPLYQRLFLDVAAIVAAIFYVIIVLVKQVYSVVWSRSKLQSEKKNN